MLRLPGLREVYDAVIAGCAELETAADALDAELWLAANVCAIQAEAPGDDAFHTAMLDLIGEAERDGRRQCLLLLRAMAAAGPQGLVDPAAGAAERLANRTAPEVDHRRELPKWVDTIGETAVDGDCCVWTDVFGEYTQVYCVYVYPGGGRRHGLLFTIDLAFRGVMRGIDVVSEPKDLDRVARDMERDARRDGGRFERMPPADACGLLRAALEASADPELPRLFTAASPDKTMSAVLPMAVRRLMTMPGGGRSPAAPSPAAPSPAPLRGQVSAAWPQRRRDALVDEFLAAHPDGWADAATARMFAARIVDASVDVLGFPPDRLGPASVARLFGEVLPRTVVIPQSMLEQVLQIIDVWLPWRIDAQDLPRAADRTLRRTALTVQAAFPMLSRNRRLNPTAPYFADTPAARSDGTSLQEILRRREFAVPPPGKRGNGMVDLPEPANGLPAGRTHVDGLDAANPTHRHLITAIGQSSQGTQVHRFPAYAAVVEQLWNDQPATVWQQARRLSAAGLPRQQILDRLARAWERHGPDDLAPDPGTGSTTDHTAVLRALGAAPTPGGHR